MHMMITTAKTTTIKLSARAPIVVVLGHVDHGKTTLLDRIRSTSVAAGESGGITQHFGAYQVMIPHTETAQGGMITFLDTPGHEAFYRMRARGAAVADVAVLVVAADDGVKPQTLESLEAIRTSALPFVVALNKTDKPDANPERVKKELAEHDVLIEEWGGKVPIVAVSAKTGSGIPQLLEMILLVAEMEDLKGDISAPASGVVVESSLDSRRGNTATLVIRDGTLHGGECIVAGSAVVRVRIFEDDRGHPITSAHFSAPVRVAGFNILPPVGAIFRVCQSKEEAAEAAAHYNTEHATAQHPENTGENAEVLIVPIIIKADVAGSLEALVDMSKNLSGSAVTIQVLRAAVGNLNEDDAQLTAGKERVLVIGFRVIFEPKIEELFRRSGVRAQVFDVIYKAREWLKETVEAMLTPEISETTLGKVSVLKVFKQKTAEAIIGGRVLSGLAREGSVVVIERAGERVGEGAVKQLQQNKVPVREVSEGNEYGMLLRTATVMEEGDSLLIIERKTVARSLDA